MMVSLEMHRESSLSISISDGAPHSHVRLWVSEWGDLEQCFRA